MKPSVRDMHAVMLGGGEEGVDAREVFSDLGVLIVEGRVPGGQHAAGRGYGEGPHCPKPAPSATGPRHDCDASFLCQRAENLRKHLQLLWQNNVPLCVELLLCSDCPCGSQKAACSDVANVPSPSDLLLEQWLVTMMPVTHRSPDPPPMNVRGLFQAVRSQLHFSQLSAWWSSSKGANPAHVNYRVTVPGEAFASQFRSPPLVHSFPLASVSKTTCIRVAVRTAPRMETVPRVPCVTHPDPPVVDDPCTRPGKHHCRCAFEPSSNRRNTDASSFRSSRDDTKTVPQEMPSVRYRSKSPTLLGPETTVPPDKQTKKLRKETSAGRKLNLELSRREFQEVLSVLRDRTGPSSHHASKVPPCSTGSVQGSSSDCNPVASVDKADLFLEAILRTSDNNDTKARNNKKSASDEVSALSRQLSKITVAKSDSCGASSGAKRKRFDFKSDLGEETLRNCDNVSKKTLSDSLFVFDDNLASDSFLKSLALQGTFSAEPNQRDFDTIDERPLMSVPRSNKLNKRRSDLDDVVPCDAVEDGHVITETLASEETKFRHDLDTSASEEAKFRHNLDTSASDEAKFRHNVDTSASDEAKFRHDLDTSASDKVKFRHNLDTSASDEDKFRHNLDTSASDEAKFRHNLDTVASASDKCKFRRTQDSLVPSASEKAKFRRNLDTAASLVFHSRTGLPLTSSPAPVRRNATCFDFDSSINCVSAIRSALFETATPPPSDDAFSFSSDDAESEGRSPCSPKISVPAVRCCWSQYTHLASSLLGTFEESVLNGRLEPVSTVQGFTANLGASGSFCPRHVTLPITVFFYTLGDNDKVSTPYLAHINLGKKGYNVPRCGTIQVTLFNPMGTVVKMFVVMYDLTDMPANSHTFLRQRTLYMPANTDGSCQPDDFQKWLRYLIHLRFTSSKSGRIYLHTDIRMIIFRKSDLDTATAHGVEDVSYELRSFTQGPTNPKFSSRK